jgi:hypothetical protein
MGGLLVGRGRENGGHEGEGPGLIDFTYIYEIE